MSVFEGYTPETVDFLWGIRLNNNREWFLEHKNQYTQTLYHPTKALGAELFAPFIDKPGELLKVSRIYRDARMHHPLPYKESLWICIRRDVEWWVENPCLYFEINPDGIHYGFFWYHIRPAVAESFRQYIAAKPDDFLKMIAEVESATGQSITADLYKRPKTTDNPDLARFFAWKGQIACTRQEEFSDAVFGPELAVRVREYLEKLIPLYDFCNRFTV
jgi:uncharacterized protein (TIGR02453 family)